MITLYKENIVSALEALSDYEFQKAAWFENDQGIMYFYNDMVNDIFDDGLDYALNSGVVVFGNDADNILKELSKVVDNLDEEDYPDLAVFIELPQMEEIRKVAKRALVLIKNSNETKSGVRFLKPGEAP